MRFLGDTPPENERLEPKGMEVDASDDVPDFKLGRFSGEAC